MQNTQQHLVIPSNTPMPTNKHEIRRVVLINCANYHGIQELHINGNSYIAGVNGSGKTSFASLMCFLQTGSANVFRSKSNMTGKSYYLDYYWPFANSFVIYETCKNEFTYTTVLFKHNEVLHFFFINEEYKERFFGTRDGLMFTTQPDGVTLFNKLVSSGVDVYPKEFPSRGNENYRNHLFLDKQNKNPTQRVKHQTPRQQHHLFAGARSSMVRNMIIDSFKNGQIQGNLGKNVLISTIKHEIPVYDNEESKGLLFKEVFESDSAFLAFKKKMSQIEDWNGLKNEGVVEKIVKNKNLIQTCESIFNTKIQDLFDAVTFIRKNLSDAKTENEQKEKTLEQCKKIENEIYVEFSKEQARLNADIQIKKNTVVETECKYTEYVEDNIVAKKREFEEILPEKQRRRGSATTQLRTLEYQHQNITAPFERLIKDAKQACIDFENEKNGLINTETTQYYSKIDKLRVETDQQKKQIETDNKGKLKQQKNELDEINNKIKVLEGDKIKTELTVFREQELAEINKNIEAIKNDINRENQWLENIYPRDTKSVNDEAQLKSQDISNKFEREREILNLKLSHIETSISSHEESIDNFEKSLQHFLDVQMPEWQDNLGLVINPTLLKRGDLNPQFHSNADSFYGLNLDLESISVEFDSLNSLQEGLEKLRLEQKQFENDIETNRKQKEDALGQLEEDRMKKLGLLNETKNKYEKNAAIFETSLNKAINAKINTEEAARCEKENVLQKLVNDIKEAYEAKQLVASTLESMEETLDIELEKVAKDCEEKCQQLKDELDKKRNNYKELIEKEKEKCESSIKKHNEDRNKALKENKIDTDLFTQLEREIESLNTEVGRIKMFEKQVHEYNIFMDQVYSKLPNLKVSLQTIKTQLETLTTQYKTDKQQAQNNTKKADEEFKTSTERLSLFNSELSEFEELNGDKDSFARTILKGVSNHRLTVHTNQESSIVSIKDCIKKLYENYHKKLEYQNILHKNSSMIASKFPEDNFIKLRVALINNLSIAGGDNDEKNLIEFAVHIENELTDSIINDKIKSLNESFAQTFRIVKNKWRSITSTVDRIKRLVGEINTRFEQKLPVGPISLIKFVVKENNSELINSIKTVVSHADIIESEWGSDTLFGQGEMISKGNQTGLGLLSDLYRTWIDLIETAQNPTQIEKMKVISFEDVFDVHFTITENNNTLTEISEIKGVGSEGTDIICKTLIYMTMVHHFINLGKFGGDNNFRFIFLLDEILRISDDNLIALLDYADECNLNVMTCATSISSGAVAYRYANIYNFETLQDISKKTLCHRNTSIDYLQDDDNG